jgi:hypothetical protein
MPAHSNKAAIYASLNFRTRTRITVHRGHRRGGQGCAARPVPSRREPERTLTASLGLSHWAGPVGVGTLGQTAITYWPSDQKTKAPAFTRRGFLSQLYAYFHYADHSPERGRWGMVPNKNEKSRLGWHAARAAPVPDPPGCSEVPERYFQPSRRGGP